MHKKLALALLGGNIACAARACDVSYQAVSQWPDELIDIQRARVTEALAWKYARRQMLEIGLHPPEHCIMIQLRDP